MYFTSGPEPSGEDVVGFVLLVFFLLFNLLGFRSLRLLLLLLRRLPAPAPRPRLEARPAAGPPRGFLGRRGARVLGGRVLSFRFRNCRVVAGGWCRFGTGAGARTLRSGTRFKTLTGPLCCCCAWFVLGAAWFEADVLFLFWLLLLLLLLFLGCTRLLRLFRFGLFRSECTSAGLIRHVSRFVLVLCPYTWWS